MARVPSPENETGNVLPDACTDHWLARDKALHFAGSLAATVMSGLWTDRQLGYHHDGVLTAGAGISLLFGVSKEMNDMERPGNHFCWKDIVADILGVFTGLLVLETMIGG